MTIGPWGKRGLRAGACTRGLLHCEYDIFTKEKPSGKMKKSIRLPLLAFVIVVFQLFGETAAIAQSAAPLAAPFNSEPLRQKKRKVKLPRADGQSTGSARLPLKSDVIIPNTVDLSNLPGFSTERSAPILNPLNKAPATTGAGPEPGSLKEGSKLSGSAPVIPNVAGLLNDNSKTVPPLAVPRDSAARKAVSRAIQTLFISSGLPSVTPLNLPGSAFTPAQTGKTSDPGDSLYDHSPLGTGN
jgi:hypothetical protein